MLVLSDEIYGELHHKGDHVSIAKYYPEGTIVSGGLSKWCGAGGWRLGTFVFPAELRWLLDAMAAVASETFTSTSAPIQHAAITAFDGNDEISSYLENSRAVVRDLGRWTARRLREAGVGVDDPEGGFYVFPNFEPLAERLDARGIHTSAELTRRCLDEAGVAFLPGSCFGRPPEERTARIAYVNFDGARALREASQGGDEVPGGLAELPACTETREAVDRLVGWLGA
jgi:aspartate aminotransferase